MACSTVRRSINTAPVLWPGTPMAMGSATRRNCSPMARIRLTRPAARNIVGKIVGATCRDTTLSRPEPILREVESAGSRWLSASEGRLHPGIHRRRHEPEACHPQAVQLLDPQAVIARGDLIADLRWSPQTGEDVAAEGFDVDPVGRQVQVVAFPHLDKRG